MRINNNLMAMNTHRQLGIASNGGAKSMEKLSSGMRINRAGDDAAGLAISEKMRGQIRGLNQASSNAQNGISMIQTAEGALGETHAILQRMRELAVQSATDTNTADDRDKIQSEVDQLAKEITRISSTTEFNTKNLLAGGLDTTLHIGANKNQNVGMSIDAMDAKALGVAGDLELYKIDATNAAKISGVKNPSANLDGYKINTLAETAATASAAITGVAITQSNSGGGALSVGGGAYNGTEDLTLIVKGGFDGSGALTSAQVSVDGGVSFQSVSVASNKFDYKGLTGITIATDTDNATGDTWTFNVKAGYKEIQLNDGTSDVGSSVKVYNNMTSAVIGNQDANVTVNFKYADLAATAQSTTLTRELTESKQAEFSVDGSITSQAVTYKGIDVSTQGAANSAIETINNALTTVSEQRSRLGAMQNRLEHTIKNLDTSSENLQASEARIRDVDMAKEMMEQTKQNILQQASTAMLAQAQRNPESVLQLLR